MKKFKCPFCDEVTTELEGMHEHIEEEHETSLPANVSINEFYYSHRTGKTHGNCVMCKRPTKWNVNTNKYNRFCGREECKEQYVAEVRKRMVGKYGKTTLLNEPEHQKKMLKNRSISGTYKWSDNKHDTDYTGSYELDFLKYLDLFLEFDPNDVIMPSPHTYYYDYEGKQHFYIPDAFIPSLNLEIEIKDGGDNPNMHHKIQDVDKVKERLKDEVMTSQKTRSYVKILNKEYSTFIQFLLMKKDEFSENGNTEKPVFILKKEKTYTTEELKENALLESTSSFSTKLIDKQQRIAVYLEKIRDCENMVDFTDFEGVLGFKPFIYSMNCCGRTDITQDLKYEGFGSINDPYGIFIDDLHDTLAEYISDAIDSTVEYTKVSERQFRVALDNLISMDDENLNTLVLRDLYSSILCLQTIMNYSKIYNDRIIGLYGDIIESYIPSLEKKVFVEPVSDIEMTLESVLLESSDDVEVVEESFKSSKTNRMYHPVYVLLTHTGTVLSNTIKSITANPYSHSSISFSPELDEMYSFGRKYKSNPLIGTFVKENIKEGLFEDVSETATYSLYVTFVDEVSYRKMKKRLEEFKDPKKKFRYNFVGLIKHQMGIASSSSDAYFCSQFVDTILSENEIDFFAQDSSLVKPYDFAQHDAFLHVSRGKLKNYDVDKVKAKVKQLEFDSKNKEEYNR